MQTTLPLNTFAILYKTLPRNIKLTFGRITVKEFQGRRIYFDYDNTNVMTIDSSGMAWPDADWLNEAQKRELWKLMKGLRDDFEGTIAKYGQETHVCAICNTPLTNDESKARGIGPVCYGKLTGGKRNSP